MLGTSVPPMAAKRRARLPWIETHGTGWRGWWIDPAGLRRRGPVRPTAELAYDDACKARRRAPTTANALTIGGAIALLERDLHVRERTEGTRTWCDGQKRVLLRFYRADALLDSLTTDELQGWFDQRRKTVSPSTLQHHLRFLRRVFGCAVRAGWQGDVPLRRLVLPAAPLRPPKVFGWDEAIEVVEKVRGRGAAALAEVANRDADAFDTFDTGRPPNAVSERDADILELLLRTGLRRSELARLRPQDVDLPAKLLRVAGKRGPRVVPLTDKAVECVARIGRVVDLSGRASAPPVAQLTPYHISRIFSRWRRRLREPRLTPHAFRHTFATELVRRGTPLPTVARILGHAPGSYRVTMLYYSASEPSLRDAVQALD